MNRKLKISILIFIILISLTLEACNKTESLESNHVKIIGNRLFEGDAKKLEPHLNLISGSAKIEYKGDKKFLGCMYEIWENGKLTQSNNIFSSSIDGEFNGDITISLKELISVNLERSENFVMTVAIGNENGYSSSNRFIERFNKNYSYSPYHLNDEIIDSDDSKFEVWGLMASEDGKIISKGSSIGETAKQMAWAMVLKVYFEDEL